MDNEWLDTATQEILNAESDEARMEAMSKFRTKVVGDYSSLEKERDDYKEKYEKAHNQNVDMFLQIQKTKEDFKNDKGNVGTNPSQTLKDDREEDEEDNLTYDKLLNDMKGELY